MLIAAMVASANQGKSSKERNSSTRPLPASAAVTEGPVSSRKPCGEMFVTSVGLGVMLVSGTSYPLLARSDRGYSLAEAAP